jgi:hypothetical protein
MVVSKCVSTFGLIAASGKFELERLCADKRVNTWCDVGLFYQKSG